MNTEKKPIKINLPKSMKDIPITQPTVNFDYEELKSIDMLRVISHYGGLSVQKKGISYLAICPFHSENTPSFSVDIRKNRFKCFGCGVYGSNIDYLLLYNGLDNTSDNIQTVCTLLHNDFIVDDSQTKVNTTKFVKPNPFNQAEWAQVLGLFVDDCSYNLDAHKHAFNFLLDRGLTPQTIKDFKLGYNDNWVTYYVNDDKIKIGLGVTIPHYHQSKLVYCNLRSLEDNRG
jgi:DNA primase